VIEQLIKSSKIFPKIKKGSKVSSDSEIYDLIVRRLPNEIRNSLQTEEYTIRGSIGKGMMTTHPWISILNPEITTTTQQGLYVVLLFNASFSAFYVSLNQGITYFENKYKSKKYEFANRVAKYFQEELGDMPRISYEPINLEAKRGTLAYGYEQTNIASKRFEINASLDADSVKTAINEFIEIYDVIHQHMLPGKKYEELVESVLFSENEAFVDIDKAVQDIKDAISKEVRVPSGVKQKLILMTPGKERSNRFNKLSMPIVKKTDWIEKAREDAITGALGELLILQHEQKRLKAIGLDEYAEKIQHVSIDSDSIGYDIKSYDTDGNGTVKELYIEVKTTTLNRDVNFYVSKNELNKSHEFNKNYAVYRVYGCNDINPKFYVAKGPIEDNFFLDPVTYSAKYKYNLQ
jgi:hypothetical protein